MDSLYHKYLNLKIYKDNYQRMTIMTITHNRFNDIIYGGIIMKKKFILILICTIFISNFNLCITNAKEPIMEYQYTAERKKVENAQFIWKSCIEELRKKDILSNKDVSNIGNYLRQQMISDEIESPSEKCERQKRALKLSTLDNMVRDKIITVKQGEELRIKLSRYNLFKK